MPSPPVPRPSPIGLACRITLAAALVVVAAACTSAGNNKHSAESPGPSTVGPTGIPRPAHVVVVVMENKNAGAVVGSPQAPYINALARQGALFTNSHAVGHPSQPNYLAVFSGSTQGTTSDACPQSFTAPNLGQELIKAGHSFAGYAEGLPSTGYAGCHSGDYARKHAPWTDFTNVPASDNRPFSRFRIGAALPTVSFVIPNICHDMHNCPVATGDRWLSDHLGPYVRWAHGHRSLLVLTWDEAHGSATNHIATIFAGPMVKPGRYARRITHYTVLRTIEDMFDLPHAGRSEQATPITGVWTASAPGGS